jgi:hypothetical protein
MAVCVAVYGVVGTRPGHELGNGFFCCQALLDDTREHSARRAAGTHGRLRESAGVGARTGRLIGPMRGGQCMIACVVYQEVRKAGSTAQG